MGSCQGQINHRLSSATSINNLDTLDIDQYINYDPSPVLSTSSYSPESSHCKSTGTPFQPNEHADDFLLAPPSRQTFTGPSHQYELHKQQTGLPVGALANTLAVNQSDHTVYGHAQRMFARSPIDGYYSTNMTDDVFDFNTAPSQGLGTDMDIDFGSPFYDTTTDFINPNAVGGQESLNNSAPSKQRAWPGMHQQQAALAKAQAQAQAQTQNRAQLQPQQPAAQQQQNIPSSHNSSQRSSSSAAPAKDPIVEERISRLLNQMRHNGGTALTSDNQNSNAHGTLHNLARAKKDEEDMDEDERLLASEEGKKLSSKERRQLRNKVSARAFRSRRKEYIGQLEGEIAAKSAEADELRAKNQELATENKHLTDLTRMLLESPAFNSFLDDLSGTEAQTGTTSQNIQQRTPTPKVENPRSDPPKDVNPHQVSPHVPNEQGGAQVGMALMPETYYDFNIANTAWADNMDSSLYDAQVYAVTSIPDGPAVDQLDSGFLSGKSSPVIGSFAGTNVKEDNPVIELPSPHWEESKTQVSFDQNSSSLDSSLDNSDSAFSLYDDDSFSSVLSTTPAQCQSPCSIQPKEALQSIELTLVEEGRECGEVSPATMEKFVRFCAAMEAPSRRVASVTSHL